MPTLNWLTREEDIGTAKRVPYRLLEEVREQSSGARDAGNMLIQGDNLEALKALLPFYAGQVKCIYIDPPYNTRSAFGHYDDNLEHSKWLAMMWPRLELLRDLLAEDGSIWISIDDNEAHYLKVVLDEIFGRKNFISNVVWQKKYSPQPNAVWLSDSHDHILCYARDKKCWRPKGLPRTEEMDRRYKNPDDDPRGPWKAADFTISLTGGQRGAQFAKTGKSENIYEITTPSGRKLLPAKGRCWAATPDRYCALKEDNRIWFGRSGSNVPAQKKFLSEVQDKDVAKTIWMREEVGDNQAAKREVSAFNSNEIFSTPKPEKLLERICQLATNPDDIILDSFLGSGTTAAVAHKMGRRYIGIEMGNHAVSHCVPRLNRVIDGEQGGISKSVGWKGGGGFRFFRLGPPAFDDQGCIQTGISFDILAAHIWFSETGTPWNGGNGSPFLGIHDGQALVLLYNGILGDKSPRGGNVLTRATLTLVREAIAKVARGFSGPLTVYGEQARLAQETLERERIAFKQTPYDIGARA